MADCHAPEADELHRRWLPPEIFADIGIVEPDSDAEDPPPGAGVVEELAVQLAGILGGGKSEVAPRAPPPPQAAPCQRAQVCGPEGSNGVGGGGAAAAWPFVPFSPVQWQVASNIGADSRIPPLLPCPPGAKLRGGTGVFLPRAEAYRRAGNPTAKDGKAPSPRTWPGRLGLQQQREGSSNGRTR